MKPLSAVLMCCALLPMAMIASRAAPEKCVPVNESTDKSADGTSICQEQKPKPRPRRAPPLLQDAPPRQEPPRRESVPITPPTVSVPAPPPTITSCDGGGCWNANGGRYNGPAVGSGSATGSMPRGGAVTDSSGRLCTTNGAFVQCF